ncbi:MAG: carboxypeptidase-like regulatory domain-containing protein [Candidatus Acidiferrales bacterium]
MTIRKSLILAVAIALSLACLLLAPTSAVAQNLQEGAVRGTVYDTTHAVVPTAKLTLTNPSTGIRRELTVTPEGSYNFDNIPPGEYTLTAVADGFADTTVKGIVVSVGASLNYDVVMPLKTAQASITVTADAGAIVDTSTAGITQLLNSVSIENLPFPGRDYRDLAQLTPTVQVVPGLRGGLRMGGQQSDYSGLVIDGADATNNYFGENFGSLETKNLTVPLEAVQEFQVVTNGFAPEFGRATGGLLNVVTKSGTNEVHGEAHEYYRGGSLTANDALGEPSNIDNQNQFGGSIGFPIRKDRQFLFLSTDIQRENGPLNTIFCPPSAPDFVQCQAFEASAGPIIGPPAAGTTNILPIGCSSSAVGEGLLPACYGVSTVGGLTGPHNQYQNFFTLLGHYDYQFSPANHFSIRGLGSRNHTNGFTGGQGQTETPYSIGTAENFVNQGIGGVFALTTALGQKVNELRVQVSGETRKRHAIYNGAPQILINETGASFGQRFYLPSNNDAGKLQAADNFSYSFGKHDIKFGGDSDTFTDRKDTFVGWSAGEYEFNTFCDFEPGPVTTNPWCANYTANTGLPIPTSPNPFFFTQGLALNAPQGLTQQEQLALLTKENTLYNNYQSGVGLYWQDKWQLTPRITVTYGLRWDGTWNPQPQSAIPGATVWVGEGNGSRQVSPPQRVPDDFNQWGPRVGIAWNVGSTEHPTVVRGAWGLYYAQTPLIFFPTIGTSKQTTVFCPSAYFQYCAPPTANPQYADFPYLFPSALSIGASDLCDSVAGCPGISYVDPAFRNPRVSNLTAGVEHSFSNNWTVSANYAYVHSTNLRTGGFSTTNWYRNFIPGGTDAFGRTLIDGTATQGTNGIWTQTVTPLDTSIFSAAELGSFGHGNYNELVLAVNKRFAQHFQFFANYTWSKNFANASSERDTETFYGPQDPFNLNIDYGRDGLDITNQVKGGAVVDLPWGITWSTNFIVHSGLAYPAYSNIDLNGDGVVNQFAQNDRPVVQVGSGKPFLLPEYPGRQPAFYNWDMRVAKDLNFKERYQLRLSVDFFNLTNASNLYSDPDVYGFVGPTTNAGCTAVNGALYANLSCPALSAIPNPTNTPGYRTVDELAPGANAFAVQFGARFQF